MAYKYKPYPAYRYKHGHPPQIVQDAETDERMKAGGWEDAPVSDVKEVLKKHGAPEEDAEKLAKSVANATNCLLQVEKMRRKKDVLQLAFDLNIHIDPDQSLKQMKAQLLEKAGQFDELKGAEDEHSKKPN